VHVCVLLGALEESEGGGAIGWSCRRLDCSGNEFVGIGGNTLSIHGTEQKGITKAAEIFMNSNSSL